MRPELRAIWDDYARRVGTHGGWSTAAVYLRESRAEQVEGFSPSAQLKGTLDEAERRRWWVPKEYVFLDLMSGRREDRAAFQDLLLAARADGLAAVLVLHTSRWARNALISRRYKDELRSRGVQVVALNAPFDVARPEGKFAERLIEAVDELSSDTIGFWVRVGLREKHERGHPLGRLPETFLRDDAGRIKPHPELAAIVLDGARRYVGGGVGFGDLAAWSQREGYRTPAGRSLTDEWWRNTLSNPLNAGYVAYRRKQARRDGGAELRKALVDGFMALEMFQAIQQMRRQRTRSAGHPPTFETYVLSGAVCPCGGKVTASSKRRLRCRRAAEHAGCTEPSVGAREIESRFGEWFVSAITLPPAQRARVASLVRAKVKGGVDATRADRIRSAIKRLSDAYTWGGLDTSDYRAQLASLRAQLERGDVVADEQRILAAIRVAQEVPRAWKRATNQQRKRMVWAMFEQIRIAQGKVVAVKPKSETAPLLALRISSLPRSRPDSNRRSRP